MLKDKTRVYGNDIDVIIQLRSDEDNIEESDYYQAAELIFQKLSTYLPYRTFEFLAAIFTNWYANK